MPPKALVQQDLSKGTNIVTNPYDLSQQQSILVINLILDEQGSVRTRPGTHIVTTAPHPGRSITRVFDFVRLDLSVRLLAILQGVGATLNELYDRATTPWTLIGAMGTQFQIPDMLSFTDKVLIVNGYETPYYWDGTIFRHITSSSDAVPPGAKHHSVHLGAYWIWNTKAITDATDGPSSLRASDVNNPLSWPAANQVFIAKDDGQTGTGLGQFTIAESGISPTDTQIAFKDFSGYQITAVFGADTFSIQKIKSDMGCMAPRTIQFCSGFGLIRLTHRGVAQFDGVDDRLISEEIRPLLFGGEGFTPIDWNHVDVAYAAQVQNPPLYLLFCPVTVGPLTTFTSSTQTIVSSFEAVTTTAAGRSGAGSPGNPQYDSATKVVLAAATSVSSLALLLAKVGAPAGTLTVAIQSDAAGLPSNVVLGSVTKAETTLSTAASWVDFPLASPLSLAAGTYWIVLTSDRVPSGSDYVAWSIGAGTLELAENTQGAPATWDAINFKGSYRLFTTTVTTSTQIGAPLTRVFCYDLVRMAWSILNYAIPFSSVQLISDPNSLPIVLAGDFSGNIAVTASVRELFGDALSDDCIAPICWELFCKPIGGSSPQQPGYFRRAVIKVANVIRHQIVHALAIFGPVTQPADPRNISRDLEIPVDVPLVGAGGGYGGQPYGAPPYGGGVGAGNTECDLTMDLGQIGNNARMILTGCGPIIIRGIEWHVVPKPTRRASIYT